MGGGRGYPAQSAGTLPMDARPDSQSLSERDCEMKQSDDEAEAVLSTRGLSAQLSPLRLVRPPEPVSTTLSSRAAIASQAAVLSSSLVDILVLGESCAASKPPSVHRRGWSPVGSGCDDAPSACGTTGRRSSVKVISPIAVSPSILKGHRRVHGSPDGLFRPPPHHRRPRFLDANQRPQVVEAAYWAVRSSYPPSAILNPSVGAWEPHRRCSRTSAAHTKPVTPASPNYSD